MAPQWAACLEENGYIIFNNVYIINDLRGTGFGFFQALKMPNQPLQTGDGHGSFVLNETILSVPLTSMLGPFPCAHG